MRRDLTARALVSALACALAASAGARTVPGAAEPAEAGARFPEIAILAYHHIAEDPGQNDFTMTPDELREQLRACREQGWKFVPLSQLLANRDHPERLPARTLVVTFDDGYRSFVDQALPILRAERVPAALAPITGFVGTERPLTPPLLGWDELRALDRAGDVEILSHSHELHGNEPGCPQGVMLPAVSTRRWLAGAGTYEDREVYRSRISDDLAESQRAFRRELGRPAQVLVWPFGVHNEMARGQAAHAGFQATLALEQRLVTAADLRSGCLPRYIVYRGLRFVRYPDWHRVPAPPVRMATVELDELWNSDPVVMRRRVTEAVTRARAVGANQVMIPVFAAPGSDGRLRASFAMNHQAPVSADIWTSVANQFREAEFRVWAVVPTLNLTWAWDQHRTWRVPGRAWPAPGSRWGTKLSPDLDASRRAAVDLVTDLAVYLPLDGIVFDDDAILYPQERLAKDGSRDPMAKSAAVRRLLEDCKQAVRAWRPECRFARLAPLGVVARPGMSAEYSMSLEDALAREELVITPLPAPRPGTSAEAVGAATEQFARRASERWLRMGRGGEVPVVFLIPAREARHGREIPSELQVSMARAIDRVGLLHRGSLAPGAGGELPLGLLESRDPAPAVHSAGKRRRD